jgi:hypothetical protein
MTKWLECAMGVALAGGLALAAQAGTGQFGDDQQEQQDPATTADPAQETTEQESWEPDTDDPTMDTTMGEEQESGTSQDPAAEMEMPQSVADMSADELEGLTIVTETGEEIGEVDRVGHSEDQQERVATVDVGGFLGVGTKTVAIPLSELEMTSDGRLQTSLTRESIETLGEFDEEGFTEEGKESTSESY